MNAKRRIILNIFWVVLGFVLFALGVAEKLGPTYSGMGGGMLGVGIMNLVRSWRYSKDADYREKVDVAVTDERLRYVRMKAWSWAGYLFVLASGVATLVFLVTGMEEHMMVSAFSCCGMLVVYWVCYLILNKKS